MRILVYLIFEFLKLLSKIAIAVFYHPVVVINREKINVPNPAIIVSNHPNTLFDPLNVGIRLKRQIFFLANSGMFASRFGNWFFSNVHCIPIQRKSDKHAVDNKASFAKATEFLASGGLLYVAPEGQSEVARRLRPLKSGTARIALGTEAQHNWQLGLLIVPSGVTYEAPNYFRTGTVVMGGEPIRVSDYRAAYEADAFAASRQLTKDLRERMESLLIHTENEEQDAFLKQIETLYRQENPISPKADFFRSQVIVKELQLLRKNDTEQYSALQHLINQLFTKSKQSKTNVESIFQQQQRTSSFYQILLLIIAFPIFLYGLLNNALAAFIPVAITRKMNLYYGYNATIKSLSGLFTFAIFWSAQTWLVYYFFDGWAAAIYFAMLYPTGILAWEYYQYTKQFRSNWQFQKLDKMQQNELIELREQAWKAAKGLI